MDLNSPFCGNCENPEPETKVLTSEFFYGLNMVIRSRNPVVKKLDKMSQSKQELFSKEKTEEMLEQIADIPKWNQMMKDYQNIEPDLYDVDLRGRDLSNIDFRRAVGLEVKALAGSNLRGARLPEGLDFGLTNVEHACKNARTLFITMIIACVYCWITLLGTDELSLFTNSGKSVLPFINLSIKIRDFYWAAPILLSSVYLYFHLYMNHLWHLLAILPARFPDGTPLDKKTFPWLLNSFTRSHTDFLKNDFQPFRKSQLYSSIFLTWFLTPVTIFAMWARFLSRHDIIVTMLHVALFSILIRYGVNYFFQARATLANQKYDHGRGQICMWISLLVIFTFSIHTIENYGPLPWPILNLQNKDISKAKPLGKWISSNEQLAKIKPVQLEGLNIRGGNLRGAFLVKANLKESFLDNADLSNANLQNANLYDCKFIESNLSKANLKRTSMEKSNLTGADFSQSHLQNAKLSDTDLSNTDFTRSNMQGILLTRAKLHKTNFTATTMIGSNLQFTKSHEAVFDNANIQCANIRTANLNKSSFFNTDLQDALLNYSSITDSVLTKADLRYSELSNANFSNSFIQQAKLQHSNLRGADFTSSFLNGSDISVADASQAIFKYSTLARATLQRARLDNASLENAILYRSELQQSQLNNVNLSHADLEEANLNGSSINNSNLQFANLKGAQFVQTNLSRSDLGFSELKFTNFSEAIGLEIDQLKNACVYDSTQLPEYLWNQIDELYIIKDDNFDSKKWLQLNH